MSLAEKYDFGSYVCHAKNPLGEASAITLLVIVSAPKFTTKPPPTIMKALSDELTINCSAAGDPPPPISWKRSKGAWEEERMKVDSGKLKISALTENDFGTYICEVKVPYYTIEARTDLVMKG